MPGHTYTDEEGRELECGDEGYVCNACFLREAAKWAKAFQYVPGRGCNPALNPNPPSEEEWDAWRKLKS